jgi:hypothetical protein
MPAREHLKQAPEDRGEGSGISQAVTGFPACRPVPGQPGLKTVYPCLLFRLCGKLGQGNRSEVLREPLIEPRWKHGLQVQAASVLRGSSLLKSLV